MDTAGTNRRRELFEQVLGLRRRLATILAIAIAAFLAYHVVAGADGLAAYRQKREEDSLLQKQIEQLSEQNSRLQEHIDRLKNDPGAIAHAARNILHYARPGEVIYKLNSK